MGLEQRITALEDEVKVLKNEIKAVLLDIREHYLNMSNPFTSFSTIKVPAMEEMNELSNEQDRYTVEKTGSNTKGNDHSTQPKPIETRDEFLPAQQCQFMTAEPSAADFELLNSVNSEPSPVKPTKRSGKLTHDSNFDIVIIAGLTQWVEQATSLLGKERAEALIEIAYAMHHVPAEIRDTLVKLIRLSPRKIATDKAVSAKDYLAILAQLDNLLANEHHETTLLSILTMTKEAPDG